MDIRYCKRCKKVYSYGNMGICGNCIKIIDENVIKIKEYLEKSPGANVTVLAEETGVDEKDILYLIRQERIELTHIDGSIRCERCSEGIKSGRYCDKCKQHLGNTMNGISDSLKNNMVQARDRMSRSGSKLSDNKSTMDVLEKRRRDNR